MRIRYEILAQILSLLLGILAPSLNMLERGSRSIGCEDLKEFRPLEAEIWRVQLCALRWALPPDGESSLGSHLDTILEQMIPSNSEICIKMLQFGMSQSGRMPLHWAISGGHTEIVEFLLRRDVPYDLPDDSKWTPLMIAVSTGRRDIVNILLAKGADVNAVNSTGQCPLHYAASKDRFEIAEKLLEQGATPNVGDWVNQTPLHRAASKGHNKMTKLLLSYNADPNFQDREGNTALHMACEEERGPEAKMLIEHGASISILTRDEKTPLDLAPLGLRRKLMTIET